MIFSKSHNMKTLKKIDGFANFVCLIIWIFHGATFVYAGNALIFKTKYKILDAITETDGHCFTACAAQSANESKFNRIKSITRKSLFLKDIILLPKEHNAPLTNCENPYEPSIVFNKDTDENEFEAGYEIYYPTGKLEHELNPTGACNNCISIGEMKVNFKPKRKFPTFPLKMLVSRQKKTDEVNSVNDKENSKDNASTNDAYKDMEKSLKLHWLLIFKFYFDIEHYGPKQITYQPDMGEFNASYECKYYWTDEELYENIDFVAIYDNKNQQELFKKFAFSGPPSPTDDFTAHDQCPLKYGCLKPHQMIPHYYYHSQGAKYATCSATNTLPVWESISHGFLQKVDRYLFAITQIWGPEISIITGAAGVLSFPKRRVSPYSTNIYMDFNNEAIPIPEIIYKMLEYNELRIIIIIHNDPISATVTHKCPSDQTPELIESWGFLENSDVKSGRTYACEASTQLLDRLRVRRHVSSDEYFGTLFLNRFPNIHASEKRDEINDKINAIKNMEEKLFKTD